MRLQNYKILVALILAGCGGPNEKNQKTSQQTSPNNGLKNDNQSEKTTEKDPTGSKPEQEVSSDGDSPNKTQDLRNTELEKSLSKACREDDFDKIKSFIQQGGDINAKVGFCGQAPLHLASESGDFEIVKYLIENGANVNARDFYPRTPLHLAAERGHIEVVKLLVNNGADVNAVIDTNGRTPLHYAARHGAIDVVKFLVEKGANINAVAKNGDNVLGEASFGKNTEVIEYLKSLGCA